LEHDFFAQLANRSSPVHSLDARVKIIVLITLTLTLAFLGKGEWEKLLALLAGSLIISLFAGLPLLYLLKRALVVIPFVAVMALFSPLHEGWAGYAFRVVKAYGAAFTLALLLVSTPFGSILQGLERLRLPPVLVGILTFTYRFLYLLVDEAMRLNRALKARCGRTLLSLKAFGGAWGSLFIRSCQRSERVYQALLARGFNGKLPAGELGALSWKDLVFLLLTLTYIGGVLWAI